MPCADFLEVLFWQGHAMIFTSGIGLNVHFSVVAGL
jgi:hypothetical protein